MKMRIRRVLAIISVVMLVLLGIGGILTGVYLTKGIEGLLQLPGMSLVLGLDHAKDIGMKPIDEEDRANLRLKLGGDPSTWTATTPGAPKEEKQVELTVQEAAELLMSGGKGAAFQDLQLAVTEDKTIQASGIVNLDEVLSAAGYTRADIEGQVGAIPDDVPIYIEFTADPADGDLGLTIGQIKLGNVTIPGSSLGIDSKQLDPIIRDFFSKTYGIDLNSLAVSGEGLLLDIQVPVVSP